MLETLLGLALLPFAIASLISLAALIYIIVTGAWKFLLVVLFGFATFVAWLAGSDWWVLLVLAGVTLFLFLYAIDGDEAKETSVA